MEKITLKKIIYSNYLKTTLTSIFFIELALLILYFNVNNDILDKSTKFVLKDVKESIYNRINDIKYDINNSFASIEKNIKILKNEHQNFFEQIENLKINHNIKFGLASNGVHYKTNDNGGSSIVISKNTVFTKELQIELEKAEFLDKNLKISVEDNDLISAAYFNSRKNYSRYYPFINDVFNTFPENIDMGNYIFYYQADLKHNPERKVVWTDVYLDPAGLGWMISAIAPVYKNDVLEGVLGLDITINKIIEKFLNYKIPYKGSSFIIDKDLKIIAMNKKIAEYFNVKNDEYEYSKKISNTIFKNEDAFSIIKNDELIKILKNVILGKTYKHNFIMNDKKYFIFTEKIEKLPWHTITLVKEDDILKDVKDLKEEYIFLGFMVIIFIVLFYLMFFIYLYKKASDFVFLVNKPLLRIISMTKTLGTTKEYKVLEDCGIYEIDKLNANFNNLARELENRTKELIETEASRAMHEKLSNTDALTKVYNRRFLEDFSKKYFKIVKREKSTLSILLVDIDDFKNINDTFGHDVGDKVLINLVNLIQEKIRENDFIVRLGGDEFLILLPNSDYAGAKVVAKKLVDSVNNIQEDDKRFTISVGCTTYNLDDKDIDSLIKRADKALYEAKNQGKNQIV